MYNKMSMLLEAYGLDKKEIKTYLYLAQSGELTAYNLAKITNIHRSTMYATLERLISKGFVGKIKKEHSVFYSALEISRTISKIKEKESIILSLIPELEKVKKAGISKVRVMESRDGQKQFNFNLFNQINNGLIKELFIISGGPSTDVDEKNGPEDLSSKIVLDNLLKSVNKKKIVKNFICRGIWNEKFRDKQLLKEFKKIGENRFLKNLPTLATTVIFGEYVAYLFTMEGKPQVIEIQNNLIAEENKAYFYYLWKSAII